MTNILLTSAGGLSGIFLSKHLKNTGSYKLVAIDRSERNPLLNWVDSFYTVPSVTDELYLQKIVDIIKLEQIEIIIPITSFDVEFFSMPDVKLKLDSVKYLLLDYNIQKILSNKHTCYEYLNKIDILTPFIYKNKDMINFPVIMKPKEGTGSKDVVLIENKFDLNYWTKKNTNYILVEYISGKEYTADCFFDANGVCVGVNVRERIKMNGGGAVITQNDYNIDLEKLLYKLESTGEIKGPVNFQFKVLNNGDILVFDFNTRFASGGLPLTVKSGFDIPNILINYLKGEKVLKWIPNKKNDSLCLIKYFEEYYLE
jgi:carbamoyl-phosphate synthase large subunit